MTDSLILTEIIGRVGIIRLNRPKVLNALNQELMHTLVSALQDFDKNPEIGCIVLTGSERAFAAGADVKEMADASPFEMIQMGYIEQWDALAAITKPIIAAVSGWCLGGGCELALACDMIVASESAKFGQPEITLGIMTGAGASQRLARTVGKAVTMEMVLNNRHLSAEEALGYGLVNRLTPVDTFFEEALALAKEIAARAPLALHSQKKAVTLAFDTTLPEGLAAERRLFFLLFSTLDQKEGMQAFLEKRPPSWRGA
ncbi:MAG: enoyl-CoA hydratase/isomerase family protein [Anaerolineales bacterium]|nr:enoyl-CoA hydratase/isomerase family protein [Anaerolineales bacterium]